MKPAVELFDTHAHVHFSNFTENRNEAWASAQKHGVTRMVLVGCTLEDSLAAIDFARDRDGIWAAVGIHPHEAAPFLADPGNKVRLEEILANTEENKVVAIGEIGLDYYYEHSPKEQQLELLERQIGMANKYDLPVIFHVRDAFEDFWPVYDRAPVKKGLIHSFTGDADEVEQIRRRGLMLALNGIITFSKQDKQLEAARSVPLDMLLLETDAPYLTPVPFRGKICKPEHVALTAEFLAGLRGETFERLANETTQNARKFFNVK